MGADAGSWRLITPPDVGAVAVLSLRRELGDWPGWLRTRSGASRAWPEVGRLVVAILEVGGVILDEVLVSAPAEEERELHLHAGDGVVSAVTRALGLAGWRASTAEVPVAPGCLRGAVAAASSSWGWIAGRRLESTQARREASRCLQAGPSEGALQLHALRLRHRAIVRLVGRPNAGKSTLFNRLLREERSLVSPVAGTTRDTVSAPLSLHGVPILLEDSAGSEGADRALAASGRVDLWVHVLSGRGEPDLDGVPSLRVGGRGDRRFWPGRLAVSGLSGAGLEALRAALAAALGISPDRRVDSWAGFGER